VSPTFHDGADDARTAEQARGIGRLQVQLAIYVEDFIKAAGVGRASFTTRRAVLC
jgi:hypothetical protein